jgi:hypothetical protein
MAVIERLRRVGGRDGAGGAPSAFTAAYAVLAVVVSVGWLAVTAFSIGWGTQFGADRFWLSTLVLWEIPILLPIGWLACLWGTPGARWVSLGCVVAMVAIAARVAASDAIGTSGSSPDLIGGLWILGMAAMPAWFLLGGLGLMWRDRTLRKQGRS